MKKNFYAVKHGRNIGIFSSWEECSKSVHKYPAAVYKKFTSIEEAEAYLYDDEVKLSNRFNTEEDIFNSLSENEAIAYVDGSNLGDGSYFSWGSCVFVKNGKGETKLYEISDKSSDIEYVKYRNIAGELFASAFSANLGYKLGVKKMTIYHDYSGIRHWALNEWKTKNKLSKYYKERFEYLSNFMEFEFIKVEGHTGDKFNERADYLAKKALGIKK